MAQVGDSYSIVEEESITYLPIDDNFCDAVDASIHRAVSYTLAPYEKTLQHLIQGCL